MGFAHDTILVEEAPSDEVVDLEHEYLKREEETSVM